MLNDAPNGQSLSSEFLVDFAEDYRSQGKAIFHLIYEKSPTHYWAGLITLAPAARKMLEKFLDQVAKTEAEYRDQAETEI